MKAVILAGGFGKRLTPAVSDRPKPMALVMGKPFLEYIINFLRRQGIREIVLCLHHLASQIMDYFGDGSNFNVSINYCIEDQPLGTAGAIKNAEKYLQDEFYVLNGDTYLELNLKDLLEYHKRKMGIATISLVEAQNPERYGLVRISSDGRVMSFHEKSFTETCGKGYINAGIYVFKKRILKYIASKQEVSLEREVFPKVIKIGEPVYGYITKGYFVDIGTPDDYLKFQSDAAKVLRLDY